MKAIFLIILISLLGCDFGIGNSSKNNETNNSNNDNSINNINSDNATNTGDCSDIQVNDGSEGFLWKPVSDSDGFPVVLLPAEIEKMEAVFVNSIVTGTQYEQAVFSGFTNPDRQTWRFKVPVSSMLGNKLYLQSSNQTCTIDLIDINQRQD